MTPNATRSTDPLENALLEVSDPVPVLGNVVMTVGADGTSLVSVPGSSATSVGRRSMGTAVSSTGTSVAATGVAG
jgi:hypothetical protein